MNNYKGDKIEKICNSIIFIKKLKIDYLLKIYYLVF